MSAAERSPLDLMPAATVAAHTECATEPAHWRAVVHEEPSYEEPALEPETDGDPAAPEAHGHLRSEFGCTAAVACSGQLLQAASVTYTARFATSLVLARAPPYGTC